MKHSNYERTPQWIDRHYMMADLDWFGQVWLMLVSLLQEVLCHYTTLHYTTVICHYTTVICHYTTLHYTTVICHYTTLQWYVPTLHFTTLQWYVTTLHFTTLQWYVPTLHFTTLQSYVTTLHFTTLLNVDITPTFQVISVFEIICKSHYRGQKRTQRLHFAILWQNVTWFLQYFWISDNV